MLNSSAKGKSARGSEASQNDNMYNTSNFILNKIKPKVSIFENAPGLATRAGLGVVTKLTNIAKETDYTFSLMKTDTFLHGIPQHRQRTFGFFWKSDKVPVMNYHLKQTPTMADYLAKIPKTAIHYDYVVGHDIREDINFIFLKEKMGKDWRAGINKNPYRMINHFLTKDTETMDEFIEYAEAHDKPGPAKTMRHIQKKLADGKNYWDGSISIKNTIATNAIIGKNLTNKLHPTEERFISPRELMWLMGLPHDFEVLDIKRNLNQITQNVPVGTAKDQVIEAIKFINDELPLKNTSFLKQCNKTRKILDDGKVSPNKTIKYYKI